MIKHKETVFEKLSRLEESTKVQDYLANHLTFSRYCEERIPQEQVAILSLLEIGQGHLFSPFDPTKMDGLLQVLLDIEKFYDLIGGIIGYHNKVIELLRAEVPQASDFAYEPPLGEEISEQNLRVDHLVAHALSSLQKIAYIFPVGGAGDRLNLQDEVTKEPYPAALLPFLNRSLLELLMRDVQAQEYLAYKLFGTQVDIPILLMTSSEKGNHGHILNLLQKARFFGKHPSQFYIFEQPMAPVISVEGRWCLTAPFQLLLKPGGHGVVWKLMRDSLAFEWLKQKKRPYLLVRQINNPIAGLDASILAFAGKGIEEKRAFGFLSCERRLNSPEGMIVQVKEGDRVRLSNIEYTCFAKKGIVEEPQGLGSPFSSYPANINLLFAEASEIEKQVEKMPLPGLLVNPKHKMKVFKDQEVCAVRLESAMQNICDAFSLEDSFVCFTPRHKTFSVTKNSYEKGKESDTPESCYSDLLRNNRDLLASLGFDIPSFVCFLYHPALGPLYSVIAQKLKRGRLSSGSELRLELAEAYLEEVEVDGSLQVIADAPCGSLTSQETVIFSEETGKCVLKNVKIKNAGVNWEHSGKLWQDRLKRKESFKVTLHGSGEFFAENVTFVGDQHVIVPDQHRMYAVEKEGQVFFHLTKIEKPTWHWKYAFNDDQQIVLDRQS